MNSASVRERATTDWNGKKFKEQSSSDSWTELQLLLAIQIRMLPIIVSTVFMNSYSAQLQTFTIEQGIPYSSFLGFDVPTPSIHRQLDTSPAQWWWRYETVEVMKQVGEVRPHKESV
ncbi:hypothetical protein SDJN03_01843, partial [Cucurbita argyrosperma subsp. sororia]